MILLWEEEVVFLHDLAIKDYGGLSGMCPDKSLESCLNRVHHHLIYSELQDIYEAAALYAEAIARGHIFVDGNKRTAYFSMGLFLHKNGELLPFIRKYDEVVEYFVDLADKKLDYRQFGDILRGWQKEVGSLARALIHEASSSTSQSP